MNEANDSTGTRRSQFQTHLTLAELWAFRIEFEIMPSFDIPWAVISFRFDEDGFLVACTWKNFFGGDPFQATVEGLRKRFDNIALQASVKLGYSEPAPRDDPDSVTWRAGAWMAFWQHVLAGQPGPSVDARTACLDFFTARAKNAFATENSALLPTKPQTTNAKSAQAVPMSETRRRKRGPQVKMERHEGIAAIVRYHGDSWKDHLDEIVEALDRNEKTPSVDKWLTLTPAAKSWTRALKDHRKRVVSAIEYSLKQAPVRTPSNNSQ